MPRILRVNKDSENQRFDVYVTRALSIFSRASATKAIRTGTILLNGKCAKPSTRIRDGDRISIIKLPEKQPKHIELIPQKDIPLPIVYEDPDILVIDKPAGISVHPSVKEPTGTLANALIAYLPKLRRVGEDPMRPGIVHRLDKDTSGLLLIAKNQKVFLWLKEQFAKHLVEKYYIALVDGKLKQQHGKIAFPLKKIARRHIAIKNKQSFQQMLPDLPSSTKLPMSDIDSKEMREAETKFRVLKRFPTITVILAHPKTGRMHQIRSHFAAIGHPIVGDILYGRKKRPEGLSRHFLHATRLEFSMPDGRRLGFESELSGDLKEYLEKIASEMRLDTEAEVRYE